MSIVWKFEKCTEATVFFLENNYNKAEHRHRNRSGDRTKTKVLKGNMKYVIFLLCYYNKTHAGRMLQMMMEKSGNLIAS